MHGFDVFALLTLIGAAMVLRGWGGRRAGNTPHCGQCGFEMTGLATDANCPECGASPQVPRVTGKPVYSRPLALGGIGVVLLAVLTLAVRNNFFVSPTLYDRVMPRSVLIKDAQREIGSPSTSS